MYWRGTERLDASPGGVWKPGKFNPNEGTQPMGRAKKNQATHDCKTCGENNPERFSDGKFSRCRKCHNEYVLARYREQQRALGRTPKLRPRRKRDYDPAIVSIASRFGLSVEQYREALR